MASPTLLTPLPEAEEPHYVFGVNYEAGKLMTYVRSHEYCVGAVHASYPLDAPFHGIDAASKKERDEAKRVHDGIWEFAYDGFDEAQANLLSDRLCDVLEAARSLALESDAIVLLQIGKGSSAKPWIKRFVDPLLQDSRMNLVHIVNSEGKTLRVKNYAKLPNTKFVFVHIGLYARVGDNALDVKPGTLLIPYDECYVGYDMCPKFQANWHEGASLTCTVQDIGEIRRGEWETEIEKTVTLTGSLSSTPNMISRLQHLCEPQLVLFGNADNSPWLTTEHYSPETYAQRIAQWRKEHVLGNEIPCECQAKHTEK